MDVIVVGAGLTGLSAAYALETESQRLGKPLQVQVVEARPSVGGLLRTISEDGFRLEGGAHGWAVGKPYLEMLLARLQLARERIYANLDGDGAYVVHDGQLVALPASMTAFLRWPLLSLPAKARMLLEPLWPGAAPRGDESVTSFFRRRFGEPAATFLADALARGVFGGDPSSLSMESAFPTVARFERTDGSVLLGLMRVAEARRKSQAQGGGHNARGRTASLCSLRDGMATLPAALCRALRSPPWVNAAACSLLLRPDGTMRVLLRDGRILETRHVVLAIPAPAAAGLLQPLCRPAADLLRGVAYAPLAVVGMGFPMAAISERFRRGYGFIAPTAEKRQLLGCLWESAVFPHRAPKGKMLVRTLLGGGRQERLARLSEGAIVGMVRRELRQLLGLRAEPEFLRVLWNEKALPQYGIGHGRRMQAAREHLRSLGSLTLTGSAYDGVAIEDCVRAGFQTAARIISRL